MIDLQSHSTFSDGELPPAEVVAAAVDAGVTTMALTDHDGIDGVAEAAEAAADAGIALIPATEISCVHGSLDDFPGVFLRLFRGENIGKLIFQLDGTR